MTTFVSTHYDEVFNGTATSDTLVLSGDAAGYQISFVNGKVRIEDIDTSDGDTGIDTLGAIDVLSFADRDFSLKDARETFVSPITGPRASGSAATALLADGSYAVAWSDGDIRLQRYDESGNAMGGATRINTSTSSTQRTPDITVLADGDYVVTWESSHLGGNDDIYMQRYDAAGNAVGGQTRVNATTVNSQMSAVTSALADGGFVVSWTSYQQDGSGNGVYAQRYDAAGNAVGGEFRVNTTTVNYQGTPAIAGLSDGGYAIVWDGWGTSDANGDGIFVQRYDAAGNAVGGETRVNTTIAQAQWNAAITALNDGGHLITWSSNLQDGSGMGIYAQRYDAAGNAVGVETRVNSFTTGYQHSPVVAALADDGYVVAWTGSGAGDAQGVYMQRYDAAGNAVGGETRVNGIKTGSQIAQDVVALDNGGFVVTWMDSGVICSQRYNAAGEPIFFDGLQLRGTDGGDVLNGGVGVQWIKGLDGHDIIQGGGGDDILDGGLGADTFNGGNGADTFVFSRGFKGGANVDTINHILHADGDMIRLDNSIFAKLTATGALDAANFVANAAGTAQDANDHIVYKTGTGELYYDSDGNGAGAQVRFAVIGNKALLTAADFEVV